MIRADYKDKNLVVNILAHSFVDNKSVNYIIKQDKKRAQRLKNLMGYSFDVCHLFGDVFLSDNKKGCALILLPEKKKTNLKSILLDIELIVSCVGLFNIKKALDRETKIKKLHHKGLMYYLWFIGVSPAYRLPGRRKSLILYTQKINVTICIWVPGSSILNLLLFSYSFFIKNNL